MKRMQESRRVEISLYGLTRGVGLTTHSTLLDSNCCFQDQCLPRLTNLPGSCCLVLYRRMGFFRRFLWQRRVRLGGVTMLALLGATGLLPEAAAADSTLTKPPQRTVLVLGDSLAAGYGLDPSEAFPVVLQEKINQTGWDFRVINAGVSGDTTSGGLRRIDWLLKRKVDVLVLELGANDGLRGISAVSMKANLQAIIDRTKAKYPKAEVAIVGMRMPPNLGEEYAREFQKIFSDLARENDAALIPFLLEGVGGKPDLNLPDRIHPTAEGQKILAENVWKVLQPLLGKLSSAK